jgi:hypothetical protein
MVGPERPVIVLFGSSIVQYSFSNGGWGAILADIYARKVRCMLNFKCLKMNCVFIIIIKFIFLTGICYLQKAVIISKKKRINDNSLCRLM